VWSSSAKLSRRLSREDTGAATVLAAALVAALVTIALGGVCVGGAAVARHRAQAAADLAALAAAGRLPLGPDAACAQARNIAAAMGAAVSGCDIQNLDVVVAVTVQPGSRIMGEARAAARAGPAGRV
jgi:secretion/DNA translocation related TadE-like protein